jgi:hypothetical protein
MLGSAVCSNVFSKVSQARSRKIESQEITEKFEETGPSLDIKEALLTEGSQFGQLRTLHFLTNVSILLRSEIF